MHHRSSDTSRILLVHERYQQAGGEDGAFDAQVQLLQARGHDVETLIVDNDEIAPDQGSLASIGLAGSTIWSMDGQRRVREAIRAFHPDIMHAHNTFPLLSPAIHATARSEGVATVQTLHNYRLVCPNAIMFRDGHPCHDCVGLPIAWPGILHACYRDSRAATAAVAAMNTVHRARRTWSRDVDQVIVLAAFARTWLVKGGVPASRVNVMPNVIDPPTVRVERPGDGFLFVGRLTQDKGLGTILAAWDRLPRGIGLTVAGSGPMEPVVRAAAERNPAIRVLGRLDRAGVDRALAESRALLAPSLLYENCPLTVLEAYAAGRAVIGSDHGGIAELVADGVTGLLVRPGDPAQLADAVLAADGDPDRMHVLGQAARAAYLARHTLDHGHAGLMAIYARALDSRAMSRAART